LSGVAWWPPYTWQPSAIVCFYQQVGDGTTTVVLLAAEFLKECKAFVEEGVHPQVSM
jgi:hypothetical protein